MPPEMVDDAVVVTTCTSARAASRSVVTPTLPPYEPEIGTTEATPPSGSAYSKKSMVHAEPPLASRSVRVTSTASRPSRASSAASSSALASAEMLPVAARAYPATASWLERKAATSGTARAIEAQYPVERYATQAHRLTVAGTDFCFRCGTRNAALALAGELHSVYLYQFDHHFKGYKDPATEACQESSESGCGVFHSSDVKFTWHNFPALGRPTDADTAMAGVMGQYFTNFAKHGNPNGGIGGGGVPVEWPKFNAARQQHLRFGDPIEVDDFYAKANCDFWLGLPREGPYNTAARTLL